VEALGIVQTTFLIAGNFRYRSVINNQAYMHLLAEARKEYEGPIDVLDITWTLEKGVAAGDNFKYAAIGTVVRK